MLRRGTVVRCEGIELSRANKSGAKRSVQISAGLWD